MKFLNSVMVKSIHSELIQRYGGSYGLRDAGLLESALARPRQLENYMPQASVAELAATLGWGLVKNHAFIDGNKRVALAAMVTFLRWNDHRLTCTEVEETAMVQRAGASEIDESQWSAWVVHNVASIK